MSKRDKNFYTRKQRKIREKTGGHCILCGDFVTRKDFSKEHLLPRVRGGSNSIDNLWCSHSECNNEKADRTLEEFTIKCDNEHKENIRFMEHFNTIER